MTTANLVQVQLNTGLSSIGMQNLASTINQVAQSKIIEPTFRFKFQSIGQQLSEFFTHSTFKAQQESCVKQSEYLVVHCKNLADLINQVLLSRKLFSEYLIKLGTDGDSGFLKVCLGIIDLDNTSDANSPPSKRLLTQRIA